MTVWTVSFKDKIKKKELQLGIVKTHILSIPFTGCTGPSEAAGKPLSLIPLFFYTPLRVSRLPRVRAPLVVMSVSWKRRNPSLPCKDRRGLGEQKANGVRSSRLVSRWQILRALDHCLSYWILQSSYAHDSSGSSGQFMLSPVWQGSGKISANSWFALTLITRHSLFVLHLFFCKWINTYMHT